MNRALTLCGVLCLGLPIVLLGVFLVAPSDGAGFGSRVLLEVQAAQRSLQHELAATMQAVQEHGASATVWLISLSFMYGILHAVGPGHGKVVISTYLMTQPSRLGLGVVLSVLTSLFQGVTAIATVGIGVAILGQSLRYTQSTTDDLELVSYALVAIAGAVVIASRARRLLAWWSTTASHARHNTPHFQHTHGSGSADHSHEGAWECCGHAHGPSPAQIEQQSDGALSWSAIAGMVIAIGIRPCSGAIVVLLVAHSLKLHWAGVGAVLAMSVGTAIAVSVLAAMAVYARATAVALSARLPSSKGAAGLVLEVVALLGGVAILVLGLLLFQSAWSIPAHPLR